MSQSVGLRAMKKRMTRDAISNAALELTSQNGFDRLTVDDIARKAIVSPRTFSNYFSCKEEAVVAAGNRYWATVIDRLRDRPVDEHPLQSMRALLVEAAAATSDDDLQRAILAMRLSRRYPALQPFQVARYAALEASFRESVAARSGTDLAHDLYPWLVAASAVAAMKAAMSLWLINGADPEDLPGLIGTAFDRVIDGLQTSAA